MSASPSDSPLDILLGTGVFVSFLTFAFLVAPLRRHIDEKKVRQEASVVQTMTAQIPPEYLLSASGKRRVKLAKISLGVLLICVAVIVVRKQIL